MNITWKGEFKRTELSIEGMDYEIFEKIDNEGNSEYSLRGPLGLDMDNNELLTKLLQIKRKEK
ncbi:MAG: hypothetical protein EBR82_51100 [Caulobacteraceae bacterium]|nr:hypothetical protein [Caulobacteraceae bacterium]